MARKCVDISASLFPQNTWNGICRGARAMWAFNGTESYSVPISPFRLFSIDFDYDFFSVNVCGRSSFSCACLYTATESRELLTESQHLRHLTRISFCVNMTWCSRLARWLEAYLYQEESLSIFLSFRTLIMTAWTLAVKISRQRLLFLGYRRLLS